MKLSKYFLTLIGLVFLTSSASATLVYNLGGCDATADSGGTGSCNGPGADIPYNSLVMTFEQMGSNNVQLTLDASAMSSNAYKISNVWFNLDGFVFSHLTISNKSGIAASSIGANSGSVGSLGVFDVDMRYDTSELTGALYNGLTSVYNFSASGLTEAAFLDTTSAGFEEAFHLNTKGNVNSGTYDNGTASVPESATMLLFGTGLIGLAGITRRKKE